MLQDNVQRGIQVLRHLLQFLLAAENAACAHGTTLLQVVLLLLQLLLPLQQLLPLPAPVCGQVLQNAVDPPPHGLVRLPRLIWVARLQLTHINLSFVCCGRHRRGPSLTGR